MPTSLFSILILCSIFTSLLSWSDNLKENMQEVLAGNLRSDAEKERDANRKPLETLEFFEFKQNQKVMELIPGGGWYTKILAPLLHENGQLLVAVGTGNVEKNLLNKKGFEKVVVPPVSIDIKQEGRRYGFTELDLAAQDIDLVLTFRNLHNFTENSRKIMHAAVFNALRSGGVYGVVDHTRRHMQADYYENWRRMDPVQMIKEIESAGFVFEDYATLHYHPDDTLEYEVGRKTVTGNTDRFTLKFRKP